MTSRIEEFRDRMRSAMDAYVDCIGKASADMSAALMQLGEDFEAEVKADKELYTSVSAGLHVQFEKNLKARVGE